MSVPSIRNALLIKAATEAEAGAPLTIACCKCKAPLWEISLKVAYGTRRTYNKKAYPGVPEYDDVWKQNKETGEWETSQNECWFCGKQYLIGAIVGEGLKVPKPYILEFDS